MDRLGLWGGSDTPFGDFDDFRRAVESRGVGMMELVAMHLKQRGALVSRALSFKSCTFELVNDVMTPSLCGVLVYCLRGDGVQLQRCAALACEVLGVMASDASAMGAPVRCAAEGL